MKLNEAKIRRLISFFEEVEELTKAPSVRIIKKWDYLQKLVKETRNILDKGPSKVGCWGSLESWVENKIEECNLNIQKKSKEDPEDENIPFDQFYYLNTFQRRMKKIAKETKLLYAKMS